MSNEFRLFPRIFSDVADVVRLEYDLANNIKPVFHFGTYDDLKKFHALQDRSDKTKYPLLWLVWEANENVQKWENSSMYHVSPRIFICNSTHDEYLSEERYVKNFEAILYPIWKLIQQAINDATEISYFSAKGFKIAEHLYWGKGIQNDKNKNVLFDTLDALEVRFDELKITPGNC